MPTYIHGPGDPSGSGALENFRLLSLDVVREASRRQYTLVLGDGVFGKIKIVVDTPDEDISLRNIFLRAAGLEVDEEARRQLRTGSRVKTVVRRGVLV